MANIGEAEKEHDVPADAPIEMPIETPAAPAPQREPVPA